MGTKFGYVQLFALSKLIFGVCIHLVAFSVSFIEYSFVLFIYLLIYSSRKLVFHFPVIILIVLLVFCFLVGNTVMMDFV